MAITYLAAGTAIANNGGTNPTPGIPAGCTDGSTVMICAFYSRGNVDESVSMDGTWTSIVNTLTSSGLIAMWWKVFQTGDTAPTVTRTNFTGGGTGDTLLCRIMAYDGVDTTSPIAQIGSTSVNGTSVNLGPISGITLANIATTTVIVFGGRQDDGISIATLTGDSLTWNNIWNQSATAGADAAVSFQYAIDSAGGTVVTDKTLVPSGSTSVPGVGLMIELAPMVDSVTRNKRYRILR